LVEHFHHIIVDTVECNLAAPHRAQAFNLHAWVGCGDPWTAQISKAFTQAFKNTCSIVAPLVLKIVADKIGDGLPIFVFDRAKQIFCVAPYLSLRLPQPDETEPHAKRDGQSAIQTSAKRKRHRRDFIPFRRINPFSRPN